MLAIDADLLHDVTEEALPTLIVQGVEPGRDVRSELHRPTLVPLGDIQRRQLPLEVGRSSLRRLPLSLKGLHRPRHRLLGDVSLRVGVEQPVLLLRDRLEPTPETMQFVLGSLPGRGAFFAPTIQLCL